MYNLQMTQATPQPVAPQAQPQSIDTKMPAGSVLPKNPIPPKEIALGIIAVIVVVVLVGIYMIRGSTISSSTLVTTISYSTIPATNNIQINSLDSCTNITQSGTYNLTSNVKARILEGGCINILSSNVKLYCSGKTLQGSGPFDAVPPYTYGIYVSKQQNVTITGCSISNFSYGIGSYSSADLNITGNNATSNYMANIYLNNTLSSKIYKNSLSRALSWQGSLYIGSNSIFDVIYDNKIGYNQLYGLNISSNGNSYLNNTVNTSSEYGFYCSVKDSYTSGSTASGNICFNNDGCSFLTCGGSNLPANISQIKLTPQVSGCGSITGPGVYSLTGPINMGSFMNVYNPATLKSMIPCIRIYSSGVTLNCRGNSIFNATYPIAIYNSDSVKLENCIINGAKGTGIGLYGSINSTVQNTIIKGSYYGIVMYDAYSDNITQSNFTSNRYGIILNNSQANNLLDINASKNSYGVYLLGKSTGNNFYNINANNNTNVDFYAASNISQQKSNIVSGMTCGTSNVKWVNCRALIVGNISYVPVTGCMKITAPGTYQMQASLLHAYDNCMTISSNNVQFDCEGDYLDTVQSNSRGFAMLVENSTDVSVNDCQFDNFQGGVSVYKSNKVSISNVSIQDSAIGIVLNQSNQGTVANDYINTTTNEGISLIGSQGDRVLYNTVLYGIGTTTGIVLNNSIKNTVLNNTVSQLTYGYRFVGTSNKNTFSNNTASVSGTEDFACAQQDSNLSAENGGINYGTSKSGCKWLAAVQQNFEVPGCVATSSPDTFSLATDYVYPYGSTCYTILNNATTLNCNGHTIIATNGGTFAEVLRSSSSVIENCYLKGFNTTLEVVNGSANVYNNTILNGPQSIGFYGMKYTNGAVMQNNITGGLYGFAVYNSQNLNMRYNQVFGSNTAYYIANSTAVQMQNNNAASSTQYGLILNGSTVGTLGGSILASAIKGLVCLGSAAGNAANSDLGGNSCGVASNCGWIGSSSGTC